jgi:hypothetical protein
VGFHVQKSWWVSLVALYAALSVPGLWAQNVTGTLTGTVMDSTGAVVPEVTVTMKNEASGDIRTTVTNTEGFFSINAVQPGDYTVSVDAKGFSKWEANHIHFDAGDTRNLNNIQLQVGSSTETVTVSGEAEQVTPVDSGEKSFVINQNLLQNVQIVGQNAAEFIKILPGFAMTGGLTNTASFNGQTQSTGAGPVGSFSANGQRTAALDITSDGAHIVDPGCNCGQAVNTVADMTAEMKVLTANFSAENSKGPVVISAIGKSGGSQFHGEAYLYARNSVFDANNAFNNSQGYIPGTTQMVTPKPDTYFYYPGANIGGPLLLPFTHYNRNRDKLFFFIAYEYYKQQTQDPGHDIFNSFVPTQFMRNGDFNSTDIKNYLGGSYPGYAATGGIENFVYPGQSNPMFPSGMIPASQMNPYGIAQFNLYPMPNVNPAQNQGNNFVYSTTHTDDMWQLRPRIDWSISDSTKLFVSYNAQREVNHDNSTLWWGTNPTVPYPTPLNAPNSSDSISVNLTKVFTPTLTNEFIFTYTNLYVSFQFANPSKIDPASIGLNYTHIFNNVNTHEIPELTGWSNGLANLIQPSGFESGSLYADKWLPTVADNIAKVWGTHTAKFGFYWERTRNQQPQDGTVNGQIQYGGTWGAGATGNAYADMLLGILSGGYAETNFDPVINMHYTPVAFYAQDSWKATRRLTLDYGMRFEHLSPWIDDTGLGAAVFDPSKYNPNAPGVQLTGFEWHKIDPSIPLSGTPSRLFFYEPRVGFAFDIFGTGKTVLRGGYGRYRFHDEQNVQAGAMALPPGSFTFSPPNPTTVSGGNSVTLPITFPYIASLAGTASYVLPGSITVLDPRDDEQPMTQSYSFTISQRMPGSSLAEVSYVGNTSKYLSDWNNNYGELNDIGYGVLFQDPSIFGPASGPASKLNLSPTYTFLEPYPNYGSIKEILHQEYSNYNSLQASWNKQSGAMNFLLNYTFSKALGIRGEGGNGGVGDPTNLKNDYGVLANDRTHVFNAAYIINLPSPIHANRFLKGVVNGWEFSGITQIQSGSPLQDQVNTGNYNMNSILPVGSVLPNGYIVKPGDNLSATSDVINGSPNIAFEPVLTCDPRNNVPAGYVLNPNCFTAPTPGHNGAFIEPYIKTPMFWNSDLSLMKNFQISETKKFQFRFSAYNFLNHPLSSFDPAGGDQNLNLSIDATGKANSNFGKVGYLYGARSIQFVGKFYF